MTGFYLTVKLVSRFKSPDGRCTDRDKCFALRFSAIYKFSRFRRNFAFGICCGSREALSLRR